MPEDENSSQREIKLNPINQPYWVALKLKSKQRRAVFDFIFENPGCVLAEIYEGTAVFKHTILCIIADLRELDIVYYEEEKHHHRRHYSINYNLVDQMVIRYRERVENYLAYIQRRQQLGE